MSLCTYYVHIFKSNKLFFKRNCFLLCASNIRADVVVAWKNLLFDSVLPTPPWLRAAWCVPCFACPGPIAQCKIFSILSSLLYLYKAKVWFGKKPDTYILILNVCSETLDRKSEIQIILDAFIWQFSVSLEFFWEISIQCLRHQYVSNTCLHWSGEFEKKLVVN